MILKGESASIRRLLVRVLVAVVLFTLVCSGAVAAESVDIALQTSDCTGGSGTLTVNIENRAGNDLESGEIVLYNSDYSSSRTQSISGGQETFYDTSGGLHHIEVYTDNGEFLGADSVCQDGYTTTTFTPGSPHVEQVDVVDEGDGDGVHEQGEVVNISPYVQNGDSYELSVETEIEIDGDTATRGPLSIEGGNARYYGREFTPTSGGDVSVTVRTYAEYGGGWQLTDTYTTTVPVNADPTVDTETPTSDTTVEAGSSVTFEAEGTDDDGNLDGVEWYVDGDFEEQHSMSGYAADDTFSYTFDSQGTYTVEADVYDAQSAYNDNAAEWTVEVTPEQGGLTVTGRDTDANTVEDAEVILYDTDYTVIESGTTDSGGDISWDSLDTGEYIVELYGPDGDYWGSQSVSVDSGETSVTVDRQAPRLSDITLTDENSDGTYAVGETINVSPAVANDESQRPVRVDIQLDTDDDGSAEETVTRGDQSTEIGSGELGYYGYDYQPTDSGTVSVRVVTETYIDDEWVETDHSDWQSEFTVSSGDASLDVEVAYDDGTLTDEVNGIVVYQDSYDTVYRNVTAQPSVENPYTFDNLEPGHEYLVEAYVNDQLANSTGWIELSAGESLSRELTADDQVWLEVEVLRDDGVTPLEDATVRLESHEGTAWRSATTESDGTLGTSSDRFYVHPTDSGSYTLYVEHDGETVATEQFDTLTSSTETTITTDVETTGTTLAVETQDGGSVSIAPPGTTVTDTATEQYTDDEEVTVTAEPDDGYVFSGWTGDYPSGQQTDPEITVTMDESRSLTAEYAEASEVGTLEVSAEMRGGFEPNFLRVELNDSEYNQRESQTSESVTWESIEPGTYEVDVYYDTNSITEFLGERVVTVEAGQQREITVEESTPRFRQNRLGSDSTGWDMFQEAPLDAEGDPRFFYETGETITLRAEVENPEETAQDVRATFRIREGDDVVTRSTTVSIPAESNQTIEQEYTTEVSGTHVENVSISVPNDGGYAHVYTSEPDQNDGTLMQNFTVYESLLDIRTDNWAYSNLSGGELRERGLDGTGVDVAIIGRGIDENSPAVNPMYTDTSLDWQTGQMNVITGTNPDVVSSEIDDSSADGDYHGWAVATSVGQFAPNASYHYVRIDGGFVPTLSRLNSALDDALAQDPDIVVMSLATAPDSTAEAEQYSDAVGENTTVILSAGNHGDGYDVTASPANGENVLAISSTTSSGDICLGSSPGNSTVDPDNPNLAAPGCNAAVIGTTPSVGANGSSYAAPFTAGAVAQLTQYADQHDLTQADVRDALTETAIPTRTYNGSEYEDRNGDGANSNDLDGAGEIQPVGAYHELRADDQYPSANVTVETVSTTTDTVTVEVSLNNTGDGAASNGGVHLQAPGDMSFDEYDTGEFDDSNQSTEDGVEYLELYTTGENATSGEITFSAPADETPDIEVRGWLVDEHDAVYNPELERYERYVARAPIENGSDDGDLLVEGERPEDGLTNPPYNRHTADEDFSFVEYNTRSVTVDAPETELVVEAGDDRTVIAESSVTLTGTGVSGVDSDEVTYSWEQTSGPAVALDGTSSLTPTFTAPETAGTLTFELTASHGTTTVTDTVSVTVSETPSSDSVDVGGDDVTVEAGETATTTFTVENTGDETVPVLLDIETSALPTGWTVTEHSDDGGVWQSSNTTWLYPGIEPSDSRTPSIDLTVPADADGTVSVPVEAYDGTTNVTGTATVTVTDSVDVVESFDADNDDRIEDSEIEAAVDAWESEDNIDGTDEELSDEELLELIEQWNEDTE